MELTPDQIKAIVAAVQSAAPTEAPLDQWGVVVGIVVGLGTIVGLIAALVSVVRKSGAEAALQDKFNADTEASLNRAHDKIRDIEPRVTSNTTSIELLEKDITYIKEGIDELRHRGQK